MPSTNPLLYLISILLAVALLATDTEGTIGLFAAEKPQTWREVFESTRSFLAGHLILL
jgi:hypothetical protein